MVRVYLERARIELIEIEVEGSDVIKAKQDVQDALDRGASLRTLNLDKASHSQIYPIPADSGWSAYKASLI